MKFKPDSKGISLALTIGLLLLLVAMTTTVNELVIRTLRASHQIEASDKAYFAAEGGVEDALYELSVHMAGYETAPLDDAGVRNDDFSDSAIQWANQWEIAGKELNDCTSMDAWATPPFNLLDPLSDGNAFDPTYCGRIHEGEKLVLNLFSDNASSSDITANQINETSTDISTLDISKIKIKFRLPLNWVEAHASAFDGTLDPLYIDNDEDYNTEDGSGLNEDGPDDPLHTCPYSGGAKISDNDCDGRQNEDSIHDPVLLWKLSDDAGHTFQPLRGCLGDSDYPSHPSQKNANICETSFRKTNFEVWASFSEKEMGTDQDGNIETLQDFLNGFTDKTDLLQMEILAVAPFELIDNPNQAYRSKVHFPYLEYGIVYTEASDELIPATYFSIKSDGYYQDFKQSITTNVVPSATTKLLDLTIIQQ